MLKPYFQDDDVTIYHGDCREVLPTVPQMDLVLTDPPYGIDYQSARRIDWQRKEKMHGDTSFPLWLWDIVTPINAMFVWCRWDTLSKLPTPKSFIVWDKGVHSMGDLHHEYGRQWEGCAFYPYEGHQFLKRPTDIIRCLRVAPEALVHPTEKPVAVMRKLLSHNAGENILDPFMGSGTTLRAAKDLGRKAIGIEIEERYCEIAAKRMSQSVMCLQAEKSGTDGGKGTKRHGPEGVKP